LLEEYEYQTCNDDDDEDDDIAAEYGTSIHKKKPSPKGGNKNQQQLADIPNFRLHWKGQQSLRPYQMEALRRMFTATTAAANNKNPTTTTTAGRQCARSGVIVLPCGAGKTLTGIAAAARLRKSTVVLCTNAVSVRQWKEEFLHWTGLDESRVVTFTADLSKDATSMALSLDMIASGCVLISTYDMVAHKGPRAVQGQAMMDVMVQQDWGLLLLDEVHMAPAATFRLVLSTIQSHVKLGLTATLVREDDLITDLHFLIGPKLYEANWMDLTNQGYLAKVKCVEVQCPMVPCFQEAYNNCSKKNTLMPSSSSSKGKTSMRLQQLLYVMNPEKIRAVEFLVRYHEQLGHKIILFSDLVEPLQTYAKILQRPMIYGDTVEMERQAVLQTFRQDKSGVQTICLSKVGDMSLNIPNANVIIQVSSHFGARMQEAQRMGRILRPKQNNVPAYFYTLVSAGTKEVDFSQKRRRYLEEHGYEYQIVTDLQERIAASDPPDAQTRGGYTFETPEQDRGLLRELLLEECD